MPAENASTTDNPKAPSRQRIFSLTGKSTSMRQLMAQIQVAASDRAHKISLSQSSPKASNILRSTFSPDDT
jgi:hypothetical protein